MTTRRTFEGKYINVEYDIRFVEPVRIFRKSSGQVFTFYAPDVKAWIMEIISILVIRKFRSDKITQFLWPDDKRAEIDEEQEDSHNTHGGDL